MKKKDQDHTFALKCDPLGGVVNVLSDHKGFFSQISPQDLFQTMDAVSSTQFKNLMSEALMHGVSLRPGISLHMNGQDFVFSMFTMSRGNVNYVMAVQRPQHIFKVYEEFMGIINEQGRLLRKAQQENAMFVPPRHNDVNRLEECMRLNNELSNMQRELTKKTTSFRKHTSKLRSSAAPISCLGWPIGAILWIGSRKPFRCAGGNPFRRPCSWRIWITSRRLTTNSAMLPVMR